MGAHLKGRLNQSVPKTREVLKSKKKKTDMRKLLINWCQEKEQRISNTEMKVDENQDNISHGTDSFLTIMNDHEAHSPLSRDTEHKENVEYNQPQHIMTRFKDQRSKPLVPPHFIEHHHDQRIMMNMRTIPPPMPIPNQAQSSMTGQYQQHKRVFNSIINMNRSHHIGAPMLVIQHPHPPHPMLSQHQSGHRAPDNNNKAYYQSRQHNQVSFSYQMQQMDHNQYHQKQRVNQHMDMDEEDCTQNSDTVTYATTEREQGRVQYQQPPQTNHTSVAVNIVQNNHYHQHTDNSNEQMNIDQNAHNNNTRWQVPQSQHSYSNSTGNLHNNQQYSRPNMHRSQSAPTNYQHSHHPPIYGNHVHTVPTMSNNNNIRQNCVMPSRARINGSNNNDNMPFSDSVMNNNNINNPGNNGYDSNNNGMALQPQQRIHHPQQVMNNNNNHQMNNYNNFTDSTPRIEHSGYYNVESQHTNSHPMIDRSRPNLHFD